MATKKTNATGADCLLRLLVQNNPPQRTVHPKSSEFASILHTAKQQADQTKQEPASPTA